MFFTSRCITIDLEVHTLLPNQHDTEINNIIESCMNTKGYTRNSAVVESKMNVV